jgi:hypothetical protein
MDGLIMAVIGLLFLIFVLGGGYCCGLYDFLETVFGFVASPFRILLDRIWEGSSWSLELADKAIERLQSTPPPKWFHWGNTVAHLLETGTSPDDDKILNAAVSSLLRAHKDEFFDALSRRDTLSQSTSKWKHVATQLDSSSGSLTGAIDADVMLLRHVIVLDEAVILHAYVSTEFQRKDEDMEKCVHSILRRLQRLDSEEHKVRAEFKGESKSVQGDVLTQ